MKPVHWTIMATHVPAGGSLGGVVRYTTELIRALAERDDVVVSAVTTRAAADTIRDLIGPRGQVKTIPGAPVQLLSIAERHAPLPGLRRGGDVVHGVKHLVPARSTALRVLTIHDMLLLDRPTDFGFTKRCLLPPSYKASIRSAELLLCVSEATRRQLKIHVPDADDRAAVVRLATSTSLRCAIAQPLVTLAGRRFALVVGDASPRKNLRTVVAAWAELHAQLPDAVLAIAGPPNWGRTELGASYESLVAAGAIVQLGRIEDSELRWAYENATVVLCPSLAEGYGLPAAEALEFGAPVLVSTDPALQEVCAGRALAVLPPLDTHRWSCAMLHALTHPTRRARSSDRTWAHVAEASVSAARQAIRRRRYLVGAR